MSLAEISMLLIIGSITGLGAWLQFRWPIMGQINRWKARRYIKREAKHNLKVSPNNLVVQSIRENPRAFESLIESLKDINGRNGS